MDSSMNIRSLTPKEKRVLEFIENYPAGQQEIPL